MHSINWKKYIEETKYRAPRDTFLEALEYVNTKGSALDIGAGALMDTKHLLKMGFEHVVAVDPDPASKELAKSIKSDNFEFFGCSITEFPFVVGKYDIVTAQRSLPYLAPENFATVLRKIQSSLKSDGILAIHVYGEKDENILNIPMTRLSRNELLSHLTGVDVLKISETNETKPSTLGKTKHFHEIAVIARKK